VELVAKDSMALVEMVAHQVILSWQQHQLELLELLLLVMAQVAVLVEMQQQQERQLVHLEVVAQVALDSCWYFTKEIKWILQLLKMTK
jgi:hypothetical protein